MYAIEVTETVGPEVLQNVEKPKPSPGPGEVLIKAEAIGVNFVDTNFRSGSYPRWSSVIRSATSARGQDFVTDGQVNCRDRWCCSWRVARAILQPTPEPPPYARVGRLASGAVADAELRCRSARIEE